MDLSAGFSNNFKKASSVLIYLAVTCCEVSLLLDSKLTLYCILLKFLIQLISEKSCSVSYSSRLKSSFKVAMDCYRRFFFGLVESLYGVGS